ncbi:MAG: ArsA family ATPase [Polyangiaceae bacterium]|nr:ArsA family ATPase [Polyangiaceae bacterium]
MSVSEPRNLGRLETKRFLIVTGKGGVGKTTVCAASALALAHKGKRVLVCMCNAKERLSTMLGSGPIGATVASVAPNVWAVNMDPESALHEYGTMALRSETLYKLLFGNKYVRAFFRAVPGMQEWTMLGKAWWHTTEMCPDESPVYDVVILDAPATGHGLDMLRVPKVILDVVPPGILRRDAERAWQLFRDPECCAVILVTLPEEMPTSETIELAHAIHVELELPIGKVVVNGILPPLFSKDERKALENAGAPARQILPSDVAFAAARTRAIRERLQAESLARLSAELPISPSFLPQLFEDAATPEAIRKLANRLF